MRRLSRSFSHLCPASLYTLIGRMFALYETPAMPMPLFAVAPMTPDTSDPCPVRPPHLRRRGRSCQRVVRKVGEKVIHQVGMVQVAAAVEHGYGHGALGAGLRPCTVDVCVEEPVLVGQVVGIGSVVRISLGARIWIIGQGGALCIEAERLNRRCARSGVAPQRARWAHIYSCSTPRQRRGAWTLPQTPGHRSGLRRGQVQAARRLSRRSRVRPQGLPRQAVCRWAPRQGAQRPPSSSDAAGASERDVS